MPASIFLHDCNDVYLLFFDLQVMSVPANGSCAIRTDISQYLINLCSPSECTAGEFLKQWKHTVSSRYFKKYLAVH